MNPPMTVYLFRDCYAPAGNTVVCVGEKAEMEATLGRGQVKALFQGEAIYTNGAIELDYLGVWGHRNTSRLRRLLRERGVDLTIQRTRPPNGRLRYFSTQPKGRSPDS